jgi:transposase
MTRGCKLHQNFMARLSYQISAIVADVENGLSITEAIEKSTVSHASFYKYATKEQRYAISCAKTANTRLYNSHKIAKAKEEVQIVSKNVAQKSFKEYFETAPTVIIRKEHVSAYIITGVCHYYGMTIPQLRSICRKKWLNRRRITMKILYDIAGLRLKEIPSLMGYKQSLISNVNLHIRDFNADINSGTSEGNKLKQEYESILKHLNL